MYTNATSSDPVKKIYNNTFMYSNNAERRNKVIWNIYKKESSECISKVKEEESAWKPGVKNITRGRDYCQIESITEVKARNSVNGVIRGLCHSSSNYCADFVQYTGVGMPLVFTSLQNCHVLFKYLFISNLYKKTYTSVIQINVCIWHFTSSQNLIYITN